MAMVVSCASLPKLLRSTPDHASSFYVNLPCGGLTFATVFLFFHPKHPQKGHTFLQRVLQLDLIGNAIILGASVMLFLAVSAIPSTPLLLL